VSRGTSLSCAALLEDPIGHDEGLILVFWDKFIWYAPDLTVQQMPLSRLIAKERTLLDLPSLLDARRKGITHFSLLLDLLCALQLLGTRLVVHFAEQSVEHLHWGLDTGLWYLVL
jgi:hypothetical protein